MTLPDSLVALLVGVGVLVAGAAYFAGQWRRGKANAAADALNAQEKELSVQHGTIARLQTQVDVLRGELEASKAKCGEDIARLEGAVQSAERQSAELRQEVLNLNQVPPMEQLRGVAGDAVAALDGRLHSIEQGVARLLTERG